MLVFRSLFLLPFATSLVLNMFQSVPQRADFMLYAKNHLVISRDSFQRALYVLVTGIETTVWLYIQLCKKVIICS